MYEELTGKAFSKYEPKKFKVDEVFRKEVEAYCGDMSAEEQGRIVAQYQRLVELVSAAENDVENSPFSPLGRLVRVSTIDRYVYHRQEILHYCTQPEHSFLLSSVKRLSKGSDETKEGVADDREGSGGRGVDSEELRRRSLPVDAENGLLVVTGMHRTGSTLLQRLLALDPQCRSPVTWEMMKSVPPVQSREQLETDERVDEVNSSLEVVEKYLCPNAFAVLRKAHNFAPEEHEEDVIVMMQLLLPFHVSFWHQNNELIDAVLNARDFHRFKCRFIHVWFQMAASNGYRPASHWLTKNPDHAQYLDVFMEEFPEANVVVTHRDPKNVVGSWTRIIPISHHYLIENKYRQLTPEGVLDRPIGLTPGGLGKVCFQQMLTSVTRMMAARDRIAAANPEAAQERFMDVCFSELMKDPVGVIQSIYEKFGYDFSDEFRDRILQYIADHPRHKHGKVGYSLGAVELTKEEVDEAFLPYRERFGKYF